MRNIETRESTDETEATAQIRPAFPNNFAHRGEDEIVKGSDSNPPTSAAGRKKKVVEIKTRRNYVYEPRLRQYNCRKEGGGGEGWPDGEVLAGKKSDAGRTTTEEGEEDNAPGDVVVVAVKIGTAAACM